MPGADLRRGEARYVYRSHHLGIVLVSETGGAIDRRGGQESGAIAGVDSDLEIERRSGAHDGKGLIGGRRLSNFVIEC